MRRSLIALLAAAGLLVGATACSSSDETTEAKGTDTTKRTTTTEDDEDDDGTTTTRRQGGASSITLPDGDFCEVLNFMNESEEGDEDISDEEAMALFAQIAERAPDELKDSFEVFIDLIEKLEGLDEDDPDAFGEAMAIMFAPEVMAAMTEISAYALAECGIEMDMMDMEDS